MSASEYDVEPIPGLPSLPPQGETILWQGTPDWRALAVTALHVRKVFVYFAILAAWLAITAVYDGTLSVQVPLAVSFLAGMSLVAAGILCLLAFAMARSTVYTLTNRRVIMRFGVALPMTVNLPFAQIESAGLRLHGDGTGDIPLALTPGAKGLSAIVLWPHVRPWRYGRPEPMLRCVPGATSVAARLAQAFAADQPARLGRELEPASAAAGSPPVLAHAS